MLTNCYTLALYFIHVHTYVPDWVRHGHVHMVVEFTLPMQLVPITTNVVSSNPAQASCARYNIM